MILPFRWVILLISLWIQVGFVPEIHCEDGTVNHLSKEEPPKCGSKTLYAKLLSCGKKICCATEICITDNEYVLLEHHIVFPQDVLLLKDEEDPKCFTRTEWDFTCFFETADNRTYDIFYKFEQINPLREKRCEMSVQKTEEGTFLHICSFPASDIYFHVNTNLNVVERKTSISLYNRTVSMEDHKLLDPPFNMSLRQSGQVGQLRVSWHIKCPKYWADEVIYRVRYSSKGMGEKTREAKVGDILEPLIPGEEVEVQASVKGDSNVGHWSSWSQPVRAVVPQSADDISLMCYTSDLQYITCQWIGSRYGAENKYKLFYKMGLSEASEALRWTEWTECLADSDLTDRCCFQGNESRKVRAKLSSASAPLSRTFYTQEFALNKSIKTAPPSDLRRAFEKDKLCLKWEAPLPPLSAHMQYEISYQNRKGGAWMAVSLKGLTGTCLDVQRGSQYSVKFRAKPDGSIYSGHWSDWSDVITGDIPTDRSTLLLLCITFSMLVTAVIIIPFFYYLSKLKQYIWPPVPNLDKFLQGFLAEINGEKWNPPITAKQCYEETTSSVVEVMSEDEISGLGKPSEESKQLLPPERSSSTREQVDGSPGTQVFPDYVTLNKDSVIHCPQGNQYVYKQVGEKEDTGVMDELFQSCHSSCSDGSVCIPPCVGSNFLNHAYLSLAEPAHKFDCKVTAARGPGNLYTNFPCG